MENLHFKKQDSIGILELNRPKVLNALNRKLLEEALDFVKRDLSQEKVKVLVITGAGERAFSAGADIAEMAKLNDKEALDYFELGQEVARALETAPCVTIAAVNGFALGGGLELALGCDFIYASRSAKLGLPEVSLGLIPGFGGVTRIIEAIGMRLAKELILSGRKINSEEALRMGLVNKVCEPHALMDECLGVAKEIISNGFSAVQQAKAAIDNTLYVDRHLAFEHEMGICGLCLANKEAVERMARFIK